MAHWFDIVVRSIFDPETEFVYTIEEDFLGKQWKTEPVSDGYSFSEFTDDLILLAKGWWLVILSVVVSAVILNKAVRDRIQRNEQNELMRQIENQPEETQDDWMEKFNKPAKSPSPLKARQWILRHSRRRSNPNQHHRLQP